MVVGALLVRDVAYSPHTHDTDVLFEHPYPKLENVCTFVTLQLSIITQCYSPSQEMVNSSRMSCWG